MLTCLALFELTYLSVKVQFACNDKPLSFVIHQENTRKKPDVIIPHTQQSDENSNDRHVKNKKLRALLRVCKRFGKAWLMSNGTSADAVTP
jgi:hypothetical protein